MYLEWPPCAALKSVASNRSLVRIASRANLLTRLPRLGFSPLSPLLRRARKKKRGANTRTGGPETPLNSASLEVGESQRKAEEPRDLFAFLRLCCCLPLLLTAHHTTHARTRSSTEHLAFTIGAYLSRAPTTTTLHHHLTYTRGDTASNESQRE